MHSESELQSLAQGLENLKDSGYPTIVNQNFGVTNVACAAQYMLAGLRIMLNK